MLLQKIKATNAIHLAVRTNWNASFSVIFMYFIK